MKAVSRQIRLMGTVIDSLIYHEQAYRLLKDVDNLLHSYERRFSANRSDSELMQVNNRAGLEPVVLHKDLYELIKLGKKHSCVANSHLNICIGPLVQLWRIGFADAKIPSQAEIEAKLSLINPYKIILNDSDQSVFLEDKGMLLDLGALAKGYIADKIMAYLREQGVESALLNLGGNVLTMGPAPHQPDQLWRIGIQDPKLERGKNRLLLSIRDKSVVTSGIYERKLEVDGKSYHHILSSETGYPIQSDIASLTIISKRSVDGEIWTTRLFGKSLEATMTELTENGLSGILITNQGEIYQSGLKNSKK